MEDLSIGTWPQIVESFPLTASQIFQQYTIIPSAALDIFYHYTTHAGLERILLSGGFRATYRMGMNDTEEFAYASDAVYKALNEIGRRRDLQKVAQSLTTYARKNLDKLLDDTTILHEVQLAILQGLSKGEEK